MDSEEDFAEFSFEENNSVKSLPRAAKSIDNSSVISLALDEMIYPPEGAEKYVEEKWLSLIVLYFIQDQFARHSDQKESFFGKIYPVDEESKQREDARRDEFMNLINYFETLSLTRERFEKMIAEPGLLQQFGDRISKRLSRSRVVLPTFAELITNILQIDSPSLIKTIIPSREELSESPESTLFYQVYADWLVSLSAYGGLDSLLSLTGDGTELELFQRIVALSLTWKEKIRNHWCPNSESATQSELDSKDASSESGTTVSFNSKDGNFVNFFSDKEAEENEIQVSIEDYRRLRREFSIELDTKFLPLIRKATKNSSAAYKAQDKIRALAESRPGSILLKLLEVSTCYLFRGPDHALKVIERAEALQSHSVFRQLSSVLKSSLGRHEAALEDVYEAEQLSGNHDLAVWSPSVVINLQAQDEANAREQVRLTKKGDEDGDEVYAESTNPFLRSELFYMVFKDLLRFELFQSRKKRLKPIARVISLIAASSIWDQGMVEELVRCSKVLMDQGYRHHDALLYYYRAVGVAHRGKKINLQAALPDYRCAFEMESDNVTFCNSLLLCARKSKDPLPYNDYLNEFLTEYPRNCFVAHIHQGQQFEVLKYYGEAMRAYDLAAEISEEMKLPHRSWKVREFREIDPFYRKISLLKRMENLDEFFEQLKKQNGFDIWRCMVEVQMLDEWGVEKEVIMETFHLKDPKFEDLNELRVYFLFRSGYVHDAMGVLSKERSEAEIHYILRGMINSAVGDYEQAILAFRSALLFEPINAGVYNYIGNAQQALAKKLKKPKYFQEALESYQQCIEFDPLISHVHRLKGDVHRSLKQYSEAIKCYDEAKRLDPQDHLSFCAKGNVLIELRRFSEANDTLGQSIRLRNYHYEAYRLKGYALKKLKRYEEAIEVYDVLLAHMPGSIPDLHQRALLSLKVETPQAALGFTDKIFALSKDSSIGYATRARINMNLNKLEEALEDFKRGVHSGEAKCWLLKGDCELQLKKYREAIVSYSNILKEGRLKFRALIQTGIAHRGLHELPLAKWFLKQCVELDPKSLKANLEYSDLLSSDPDEAIEFCSQAIEQFPTEQLFYKRKALGFELKQNQQGVLDTYSTLVNLQQPDSPVNDANLFAYLELIPERSSEDLLRIGEAYEGLKIYDKACVSYDAADEIADGCLPLRRLAELKLKNSPHDFIKILEEKKGRIGSKNATKIKEIDHLLGEAYSDDLLRTLTGTPQENQLVRQGRTLHGRDLREGSR